MSEVLVVLNPVAGTTDPQEARALLRERLQAASLSHQIQETEKEKDVTTSIRKAIGPETRLVIAAGGDGTVSAAAGAIADTEIQLGVLPTGTANVFALELGIPEELEKALEIILEEPKVRTVDIMDVGERCCVLNVGVGVSASLMGDTEREQKRRLGFLAYVLTGIKKLAGYQPHHFTLHLDGHRHVIGASEVMIANSAAIGTPALRLQDGIRMDDGRLEVCVLQTKNLLDYAGIALRILFRQQRDASTMKCFHIREEARIDARERLQVQGDGDVIGHTPVTVRLLPRALKVLVPEEEETPLLPAALS